MHELSIAMSIVDVAVEELARQGGGRVESIHIRVGPLSGVLSNALASAYELAIEHSPLEGSRLVIEHEPVEIRCCNCGVQPVESIQEMRCKSCGALSADVVRGRALEVVAMEICDAEPTAIG